MQKINGLLLFFYLVFCPVSALAAETNFITPVIPVRAPDYWRQGGQMAHLELLEKLITKHSLPVTWLVHYDVLSLPLANRFHPTDSVELGLFLEVTRKLADESQVQYHWQQDNWSSAYRVFLSGYSPVERRRLIDQAFTAFKSKYGFFPASYGAWYIDVNSMEYIKSKYGAKTVLGLADQYSTDGYQTWGQYLNQPYIVSIKSAIEPAVDSADSTGVVKVQWAPREPTLFYGNSVSASNFSAQVNDYHRHKGLGQAYFSQLLSDILLTPAGKISQVVIGIEVGELEPKYFPELDSQFRLLGQLAKSKKVRLTTLKSFSDHYFSVYPSVSPGYVLSSSQSHVKTTWVFSPQFRIGLRQTGSRLELIDLRFYHYSPYRDNDQVARDVNHNLVRLVPAKIDAVVMKNPFTITENIGSIRSRADSIVVNWGSDELVASPGGIRTTSATLSALLSPPSAISVRSDLGCHDTYGSYASRFPCIVSFFHSLVSWLPDLVYSSLHQKHYFGLRITPQSFIGFRFPGLKFGKFTYDFPVMSSFLSLRAKLQPNVSWYGKQEREVDYFKTIGLIEAKGGDYGQSKLIPTPGVSKIFENGYYSVYQSPNICPR